MVILLQLYVHDEQFVADALAHQSTQLALLFVDPDVLDHVGGEVVEHDGAVFLEKVLAVEQEAFHLFPVDKDAAVVLQFRTGQLADEGIEHGTFLELEGIGVVDDGVAAHVELYLGGLDDGLVQLHLARSTFHDDRVVQDGLFALPQFVDAVGPGDRFVSFFFQVEDVCSRLGERGYEDGAQVGYFGVGNDGPFEHQDAVLRQQLRLYAHQWLARHVVQHLAIEYVVFFLHHVIYREQGLLLGMGVHGQKEEKESEKGVFHGFFKCVCVDFHLFYAGQKATPCPRQNALSDNGSTACPPCGKGTKISAKWMAVSYCEGPLPTQ